MLCCLHKPDTTAQRLDGRADAEHPLVHGRGQQQARGGVSPALVLQAQSTQDVLAKRAVRLIEVLLIGENLLRISDSPDHSGADEFDRYA